MPGSGLRPAVEKEVVKTSRGSDVVPRASKRPREMDHGQNPESGQESKIHDGGGSGRRARI